MLSEARKKEQNKLEQKKERKWAGLVFIYLFIFTIFNFIFLFLITTS